MANSKRKCSCGCGNFERRDLMLITPSNLAFITADHAASYAKSRGAKLRGQKEKAENQAFKQRKREFQRNDIGLQKDYTQSAVNKLCLLLDKGKPCISCGRPDDGGSRKRNASHYKSRGANSALRFDLRNLHAACVVCNLYQSGNIAGYKLGLSARYGAHVLDYLDSGSRVKEWTCDELTAMRKEFNAEIRHIEKGNPPSKDWRSIQSQEARLAGRGEQERAA